jgi:hypothetical protein
LVQKLKKYAANHTPIERLSLPESVAAIHVSMSNFSATAPIAENLVVRRKEEFAVPIHFRHHF